MLEEAGVKRKYWVISDTHFNHHNIIEYCNRPFKNKKEMDSEIIKRWNEVISEEDVVFHLGDIVLGNIEYKQNFYKNINKVLKGQKIFIKGNHDSNIEIMKECGLTVVEEYTLFEYGIVFTHAPISKKKLVEGFINIHGHTHDTVKNDKKYNRHHFCACVELSNYYPFLLEDILVGTRGNYIKAHFWKNAKFDFRRIPKKCSACDSKRIRYTSNAEIYNGKQYGNGYCYICDSCRSYVGVHNVFEKRPLGRFSNREMNALKMRCHELLDPYWKNKKFKRTDCYGYVAHNLGLMLRETHFGWFDTEYLEKAIVLLEQTKDYNIINYIKEKNKLYNTRIKKYEKHNN